MPLLLRISIFLIVSSHSVLISETSRTSNPNSTSVADDSLLIASSRFLYADALVSLSLRSMRATCTAATSSTPPSFSIDFISVLRALANSPLLMSSLLSS